MRQAWRSSVNKIQSAAGSLRKLPAVFCVKTVCYVYSEYHVSVHRLILCRHQLPCVAILPMGSAGEGSVRLRVAHIGVPVRRRKTGWVQFLAALSGYPRKIAIGNPLRQLAALCIMCCRTGENSAAQTSLCGFSFCSNSRLVPHEIEQKACSFILRTGASICPTVRRTEAIADGRTHGLEFLHGSCANRINR